MSHNPVAMFYVTTLMLKKQLSIDCIFCKVRDEAEEKGCCLSPIQILISDYGVVVSLCV